MSRVENEIIEIIEEYTTDEITAESALLPLGISSLNIMKIVVCIEKKFKIRVSEDELELAKFKYVSDIIKVVESELEKQL